MGFKQLQWYENGNLPGALQSTYLEGDGCDAMAKPELNRVVARFRDGNMLKGYSYDFTPLADSFHLAPAHEKHQQNSREIMLSELKALFFVKTFAGNPSYDEKKRYDEVENPHLRGMKIKVTFFDGEVIRGTTQGYSKDRKAFFLFPVDPQSNNDRIYVMADALRDVKLGSEAEQEETITIACPHCKAGYTVSANRLPPGKRIVATCKKCGSKIIIQEGKAKQSG